MTRDYVRLSHGHNVGLGSKGAGFADLEAAQAEATRTTRNAQLDWPKVRNDMAGGSADAAGALSGRAASFTIEERNSYGRRRIPIYRSEEALALPSQFTSFMRYCQTYTGHDFQDPEALYRFSVADYRTFWSLFLDWSHLICEGSPEPVCVGDLCETAVFFPNLKLNYVENLLRIDSEEDAARPALTICHSKGLPERLTRGQLRNHVVRCAAALKDLGVEPGDRVVAVAHNNAEVIIGALAAVALGATFSSASPDMGAAAILSRFRQLTPSILMANLLTQDQRSIAHTITDLTKNLPSLKGLILLDAEMPPENVDVPVHRIWDIAGDRKGVPVSARDEPMCWPRFPFNHPLFVLFSSGTTGQPKCIVHGAGGTLIEHVKEHRLHIDLAPSDKLFFHTSAAWMMWNWQLSALACGAEIVTYDGPLSGPETLWRLVADQQVTVFGTSPPYLKLCSDAHYSPKQSVALPVLRAVLSTGSILYESEYEWVRDHVGPVPLQSISGGTDIIGCFVLGHPCLPVYPGECQSRSLGLDVRAARSPGEFVHTGMGDLVCCNPFPSRPLGFVNDPNGVRFHEAYFSQNLGVWTHGDLIELTDEGTARMYGRSDSVLNVNGYRIGPGEIYQILTGIPEIRECMAVEQQTPEGLDRSRMVLLVVPHEKDGLTDLVRRRIRQELVRQASPVYIPSVIAEVEELPVTYSGKRSERAARDTLNGKISDNMEALRNPACLEAICRQVSLEDSRIEDAIVLAESEVKRTTIENGMSVQILATVERLWRKLLHHPPGALERWDEAGGDSLKLLRFTFELEEVFDQMIPLECLRMNMTAKDFATAIEYSITSSQEADSENDERKLVFFFPGTMGDTPFLVNFRAELEDKIRFKVIRYPEWREMMQLYPSLEELAELAEKQITSSMRAGDISLVGYSFGGAVAAATAARLSEKGRFISFIAILDTNIGPEREGNSSSFGRISRALKNGVNGGSPIANAYDRVRVSLSWKSAQFLVRPYLKPILRWLGTCDANVLPNFIRFDLQRSLTGVIQTHAFQRWVRDACKSRLPCPAVVFRSDQTKATAEPDLGWSKIFDALEFIDIRGDHIEMLQQPDMRREVATYLSDALVRH